MDKSPLSSKTIWGILILYLGSRFGLSEDSTMFVIEQVGAALAAAFAVYGRLKADTPIRMPKVPPAGLGALLALALVLPGLSGLSGCAAIHEFTAPDNLARIEQELKRIEAEATEAVEKFRDLAKARERQYRLGLELELADLQMRALAEVERGRLRLQQALAAEALARLSDRIEAEAR